MKASLPRTKCIACGQRKQTYRVGPKPTDRACGDCIPRQGGSGGVAAANRVIEEPPIAI